MSGWLSAGRLIAQSLQLTELGDDLLQLLEHERHVHVLVPAGRLPRHCEAVVFACDLELRRSAAEASGVLYILSAAMAFLL